MEFDLIPQLLIVFSVGMIILILGLNISKIKDIPDDVFLFESSAEKEEKEKFRYLLKRLMSRINKEEYKKKADLFWIWLEKTLRKLRINFLKLDNRIVALLGKLREKNIEKTDTKAEKQEIFSDEAKKEIAWSEMKKERPVDEKLPIEKIVPDFTPAAQIPAVEAEKNKAIEEAVAEMEKVDEKKNVEVLAELPSKEDLKTEKEYINMIFKNPADIKAYWKLGIVYSRRKNYQDAVSCFRQIIKIDPTYTKARKKIAELAEKMGKRGQGKAGRSKDKEEIKEEAKEEIREEVKEDVKE